VLADRGELEWPSRGAVEQALAGLTGPQQQRPPAYSAKRVQGERSHRLARRGAAPEPAPAAVEVHRLELLAYQPPLLRIGALVGPGTYLRALARDLGERLGTGAHTAELRRVSVGPWGVEAAHPLGGLSGREPLLTARELVGDLPGVALSAEEVALVGHGRDVCRSEPTAGEAALLDGERLVAVARAVPAGWHPAVVLA
jgi:tRNA pseudouridine55 synthase